jgi:hypothetical protein
LNFFISLVNSFFSYPYDILPESLPPTASRPESLEFGGDDTRLDSELVTQSRSCTG